MRANIQNRFPFHRRLGLTTGLGLTLALAGSVAGGSSAHAGPKDFVIFTPGLGGDSAQAQPYIDKFAQFLEGAMGWPKGSAKGSFLGSRKEALAAIESQKPGFGVMEPSLYLELRKTHKAEPLAQVDSAELTSTRLHVLVKNPAYKSLAELAGKSLWTTLADAPKYLSNVVLEGKGPAATPFVLKQVGIFTKGVRAVIRGEADATVVNDEQLAAAKKLEGGAELRSIYDSPVLPALVVVSLDGALPGPEAQKLTKTLLGMCGQAASGGVCKELHITQFVSTNTAVLSAAQKRFEQP